jgi:prepilin-type N-terminal cleavage/methylation domain-containing protein
MGPRKNFSRQRGFSLAEVLVATAILVIVLVGILTLYDRANRVFKSGNEASELQQNVRIAYEKMVGDIRMAGFDYKRGGPLLPGQTAAPWAAARPYSAGTIVTPVAANGHTYRATNAGTSGSTEPSWPTGTGATVIEPGATPPITWQENGGAVYEQPDEQIEYAGATALTVRANFDYSVNPTANDHGVDANLESAQFPLVTTGNDEIVTYGLVSNTAPSGTAPNNQTITFYADTNVPRSAYPGGTAENQVNITGVDLTNANPPYTLYRFTLDNSGNVVRTPLADNIRSLNFFYFQDTQGQRPLTDATGAFAPNIGGAGQYNPTVANSVNAPERLVRKKIRAIRVRMVGMNSQPDVNYTDTSTANGQYSSTDTTGYPVFASDTIAPTYRRLTVDTLITPRNLGMTGLPQNFLQPPPRPTISSVCFGYCGIAVVSWNPNTNNPDASYAVMWDTNANGSFSNALDAGTSNTLAVDLTQQDLTQTFYFEVRAYNAGGSVFSTNVLSASVTNSTTPNPPAAITASGGNGGPALTNKVHLTWTAPVTNASGSPSCTSGTPSVLAYIREIKGYRVYRGTNANFNAPGPQATLVVDENASGSAAPQTDGYGNYTYDDNTAQCGIQYYYRVQTVEWCAASAAYNTSLNVNDSFSAMGPDNAANGILGQVGTSGIPRAPVNLQVAPLAPVAPPQGMTNSACNAAIPPGSGTCYPINLMWSKVTQDQGNNTIQIDSYDIERTQLLFGVVQPGQPTTTTITGALAMPGSSVTYTDTAPMHTVLNLDYTYSYRVRARQGTGGSCPAGAWTLPVIFPPPCSFSGSVIVETGATLGDGLTTLTPWIMNAGDTIQVQPPAGTTFVNTSMQIADQNNNIINTVVTGTSPANFTWADLSQGLYTVTFSMTNSAFPPCTQQLVRYIEQQPIPVCTLTTFATNSTVLSNTATPNQLQMKLINTGSDPITLTGMDFVWTQPSINHGGVLLWNSIVFPSSSSIAVNSGTSGNGNIVLSFGVSLSPRPGTVTAGDVTVPANGSENILFNFSSTHVNVTPIAPSDINSICISYQTPTQGLGATGFTFHCRVKPDVTSNNPNSCP